MWERKIRKVEQRRLYFRNETDIGLEAQWRKLSQIELTDEGGDLDIHSEGSRQGGLGRKDMLNKMI